MECRVRGLLIRCGRTRTLENGVSRQYEHVIATAQPFSPGRQVGAIESELAYVQGWGVTSERASQDLRARFKELNDCLCLGREECHNREHPEIRGVSVQEALDRERGLLLGVRGLRPLLRGPCEEWQLCCLHQDSKACVRCIGSYRPLSRRPNQTASCPCWFSNNR